MTKIAAQIYSWDFDPQRKGIPGFVWSAFFLRNNCAVGATIGSGFCEKNFTFYRSCIIIYGNGDALLGKCGALRKYSEFIGLVRKARAEGKDEPLTWAVKEAIGRGILRIPWVFVFIFGSAISKPIKYSIFLLFAAKTL